jgi:hypothetical protein
MTIKQAEYAMFELLQDKHKCKCKNVCPFWFATGRFPSFILPCSLRCLNCCVEKLSPSYESLPWVKTHILTEACLRNSTSQN